MFEIRHCIRLEMIWAQCQTYGGYRIFVWTRLPLPLLSLTHRHKGPNVQPSSPQDLFLTTVFSVSSEPRRASPSRGARPPRAGAGWPEARRHGAPNAATDWSSQRRPHGDATGGAVKLEQGAAELEGEAGSARRLPCGGGAPLARPRSAPPARPPRTGRRSPATLLRVRPMRSGGRRGGAAPPPWPRAGRASAMAPRRPSEGEGVGGTALERDSRRAALAPAPTPAGRSVPLLPLAERLGGQSRRTSPAATGRARGRAGSVERALPPPAERAGCHANASTRAWVSYSSPASLHRLNRRRCACCVPTGKGRGQRKVMTRWVHL
jgi:hypothetical protein